jgi:hypothetical protein
MTTERMIPRTDATEASVPLTATGQYPAESYAAAAVMAPARPVLAGRAIDVLAYVPASAAAATRVITFLMALYVLYVVALALSALGPAPRGSLAARLTGRTRYALWMLERRGDGSDVSPR